MASLPITSLAVLSFTLNFCHFIFCDISNISITADVAFRQTVVDCLHSHVTMCESLSATR